MMIHSAITVRLWTCIRIHVKFGLGWLIIKSSFSFLCVGHQLVGHPRTHRAATIVVLEPVRVAAAAAAAAAMGAGALGDGALLLEKLDMLQLRAVPEDV